MRKALAKVAAVAGPRVFSRKRILSALCSCMLALWSAGGRPSRSFRNYLLDILSARTENLHSSMGRIERSRRRRIAAPEPNGGNAMTWISAVPVEKLRRDGKLVAKLGGKQIALFAAGDAILACNNRCPHEGYPLREGTLDGGCVLTCNWHGWKFDLRTGDNLLRGDRLRTYPTRIADGAVWVDVSDPPPEQRRAQALANLRTAFDDHEYDRVARELARLRKANADPVEAVAAAIRWSHDRLRFGTTHAYPTAAGWLALYDQTADAELRVVCLVEAIGHMSWDCLREPVHPFNDDVHAYDAASFLAALEAQD